MARGNGKSEAARRELDRRELDRREPDIREMSASERAEEDPEDRVAETASSEQAARDAELQKLKAERDALIDRLARLQAEFENARKRSVREQQDFREFALADALRTLLPVLDSFERALESAPAGPSEFRSGIDLIHKQLQDALQKLGLRAIQAKGESFDPHLHEAIEMVDTNDAADHEVLEELQSGYKLKDRLLRPAMVKVARNSKQ